MTCVVSLGTNNQASVFKESKDMSEEAYQFLTVLLCLLIILELIFKWFYSTDIYAFDLFCIEPLVVHSYLNDIVIWGLKRYLDCV
jgi:hypothetical protein